MNPLPVFLATVDPSTPLVLKFNIITALMGVSALLIVTVIGLSVFVAISSFFSKNAQDLSEAHFKRS